VSPLERVSALKYSSRSEMSSRKVYTYSVMTSKKTALSIGPGVYVPAENRFRQFQYEIKPYMRLPFPSRVDLRQSSLCWGQFFLAHVREQ
jgi:hypothetical protein